MAQSHRTKNYVLGIFVRLSTRWHAMIDSLQIQKKTAADTWGDAVCMNRPKPKLSSPPVFQNHRLHSAIDLGKLWWWIPPNILVDGLCSADVMCVHWVDDRHVANESRNRLWQHVAATRCRNFQLLAISCWSQRIAATCIVCCVKMQCNLVAAINCRHKNAAIRLQVGHRP